MSKGHVLITGGAGFVGTHLHKRLISEGYSVSVTVRSALKINKSDPNTHIIDLADRAKVYEFVRTLNPDYVFHLAAEKNRNNDPENFSNVYDTNILMALNLIGACRKLENFKRFIFLGSCDEYGLRPRPYNENQQELPASFYGLSKLATTKLLSSLFHTESFPSVVLRASVIYGPEQNDQMFIPSLIQSLITKKDFSMTLGEQFRDFVYISDVIEALIKTLLADKQINGKVINVGLGTSYKVNHIAKIVANLIAPDAFAAIKFGDLKYRPNEVMDYSMNISLASELLAWTPKIDVKEGIQKTVSYFKQSTA